MHSLSLREFPYQCPISTSAKNVPESNLEHEFIKKVSVYVKCGFYQCNEGHNNILCTNANLNKLY